jgi:hypothetical protein
MKTLKQIWFIIRWPFAFIALILLAIWIGFRLAIKTILEVLFPE